MTKTNQSKIEALCLRAMQDCLGLPDEDNIRTLAVDALEEYILLMAHMRQVTGDLSSPINPN